MDDALAQPPMLVRAAVKEREDLALGGAEDRDVVAARDLHGAAAAHGDFIDPADVEPFSDHAISSCGVKRAIGACCSRSAPSARCAPGSSCQKPWALREQNGRASGKEREWKYV